MTDQTPEARLAAARLFVLRRTEDVSRVSGTGDIAQGVVFGDGTAVLRWTSAHRSTAVYASIEELETIHGHDGKTSVVFAADLNDAPRLRAENERLREAIREVSREYERSQEQRSVIKHMGHFYNALDKAIALTEGRGVSGPRLRSRTRPRRNAHVDSAATAITGRFDLPADSRVRP